MKIKPPYIIALIVLIILAVLFFLWKRRKRRMETRFLNNQVIRVDAAGNGHFGAKRGSRKHQGVDLLVQKGDNVLAPEDGLLKRAAYPYVGDMTYSGFEFIGDSGKKYKVFYLEPKWDLIGERVNDGDIIGTAQAISERYPQSSMKDHIHIEIRENNLLLNPEEILTLD